ncbi:hypothetical protein [Antarcticimicrobium sediminis]|uniref:Uncharacterized protein n=1 Tax=Antarcticimicrobium sediminis TaxID=2546227 RepID=A0A4R5EHM3_9RHOB|nr:hypothetical protein [Antarcticimicrobium sediminis]TDE33834.1 hypothetical protein E1B25_20765 [Antarcticimicrobium sediminis]
MSSVTTAFELMKLELETAVEDLNTQGSELFRESRYEEAKALIDRGKQLRAFCDKVEALANEWTATFSGDDHDEDTEKEFQTARTILSASRGSCTRLLVKFSDGTIFAEKTAAQTLAKVIERIGCEQVASVGVLVNGEKIVSTEKSKKYSDIEVPPYFIKTHSSTDQKKRNLEQISKALGLNLNISII